MNKYGYYPFKNSFDKLNGSDLKLLTDVAEGWYIDYKREQLKSRDIAKHLSSFANQYGGFLIFGIDEDRTRRTAGAFPGIEGTKVQALLVAIGDAAATHVNPVVYYEEKIIHGPVQEISLAEDKAIVVIYIPQGPDPPYIHSSGRIYRRVGDRSNPKPETDRYLLDKLSERGLKTREKWSEFLNRIPPLPQEQKEMTWSHIYLLPEPFEKGPDRDLDLEDFKILGQSGPEMAPWLPMNRMFPTVNGYIAQQITNVDPTFSPLCLRWWHNGTARFSIPINTYDINTFPGDVNEYEYAKEYIEIAHNQRMESIKIADFSQFLNILTSLLNQYMTLRKTAEDKRNLLVRVILQNTWRKSPFLDDETYIKKCSETGIPVIEDLDISVPQEAELSELTLIDLDVFEKEFSDESKSDKKDVLLMSIIIARLPLQALGIVSQVSQTLKRIISEAQKN